MEKIVSAAIRVAPKKEMVDTITESDGQDFHYNSMILSLPRPHRHHHLMVHGYILKGCKPVGPHEQGFLTSQGEFVSREDAMYIAINAEQVIVGKTINTRELFSEDLW